MLLWYTCTLKWRWNSVSSSYEMLTRSNLCWLVRENQTNISMLRMILPSRSSFIDFIYDMITFDGIKKAKKYDRNYIKRKLIKSKWSIQILITSCLLTRNVSLSLLPLSAIAKGSWATPLTWVAVASINISIVKSHHFNSEKEKITTQYNCYIFLILLSREIHVYCTWFKQSCTPFSQGWFVVQIWLSGSVEDYF